MLVVLLLLLLLYHYYYWYLNLIMVSKLESGTQVSLTKTAESSTWNLESVARNLESKQYCLGVPYMPGEQCMRGSLDS